MSKVPNGVKAYLASSKSALEDSDTIGGAFKHNATRYFLLISAWELYELADAELEAWVWKNPSEKKIYKDHGAKLTKAPTIHHVLIKDRKPIETEHSTAEAKSKIRQWTIFGKDGQSRDELFFRGWDFDTFRNDLIGRLGLLDVTIKAMESLDD
jgi:hypothetical protein